MENLKRGDIEISVDFMRPEKNILYRIEDDEFTAAPFQTVDFYGKDISEVMDAVEEWLEGSY